MSSNEPVDMVVLLDRFNQLLKDMECRTAEYLLFLDESIDAACKWASETSCSDELRSNWTDFGIEMMKKEVEVEKYRTQFRDQIRVRTDKLEEWVREDGGSNGRMSLS